MTPADYPALWRSSTAASDNRQWWYFFLVRLHLSLLAATALVAAWSPVDKNTDHGVAASVAFTMFAALIVGLVLRLGKLDDAWFQARAFAENAKGAAWRFMMKPRAATPAQEESQERAFIEELEQVRGRFPQVEKHLSKHDGGGHEITALMRDVRGKSVGDRLTFYKQHRLQNQIDWYRSKAKANAEAEGKWFGGILIADGLAVVLAVVRILSVHEYNPTGALAAVAACLLAWTQAKRFSDLSNTYGVACRDLNGLATRAEHVHDELALTRFVGEVEGAISREHRLWVERRAEG